MDMFESNPFLWFHQFPHGIRPASLLLFKKLIPTARCWHLHVSPLGMVCLRCSVFTQQSMFSAWAYVFSVTELLSPRMKSKCTHHYKHILPSLQQGTCDKWSLCDSAGNKLQPQCAFKWLVRDDIKQQNGNHYISALIWFLTELFFCFNL